MGRSSVSGSGRIARTLIQGVGGGLAGRVLGGIAGGALGGPAGAAAGAALGTRVGAALGAAQAIRATSPANRRGRASANRQNPRGQRDRRSLREYQRIR